MRLFEITPDNNMYLKMRGKEELQAVITTHMLLNNLYDKLLNGYQFSNNSREWQNEINKFKQTVNSANEYLNNLPDQNDSFINNFKVQFENRLSQANQMTAKLKQLAII